MCQISFFFVGNRFFYLILKVVASNMYGKWLILVRNAIPLFRKWNSTWSSYLQRKPWKYDKNIFPSAWKLRSKIKQKQFIAYNEWNQLRKSTIHRHNCFFFFPINFITFDSWFLSPKIDMKAIFCPFSNSSLKSEAVSWLFVVFLL